MDHSSIERKWQLAWAKAKLGDAEVQKRKKKFFMIFAYPGISGYLHVGHMRGFSYTDMISRYKRMNGHQVLFPVGTHSSGNQAIAFAKKVQNKDKAWLEYLERNGCPKEKISTLITADEIIKHFNSVYVEDYWKKFGFLCDWRRFTCTSFPDYKKFIQWQFRKLYQSDLLVQKPYFATFCPEDGPVAVDPSETDISKGGNAETNEYVLLKFAFGDMFLVAATLRPETIYGQTNLWVRPDVTYVKVEVEGETWVMSAPAAEKLAYQKDDVMVVGEVSGSELIGKTVIAPGIEKEIPILPSTFISPDVGSGIVTSVPSDAPYDYIALKDLGNSHGADKISIISIIKIKGYGDFPVKEIIEKLGINSQKDVDKLEEATKEMYKVGFHKGVMRENCGKYAGKSVAEAKELMKEDLLESGKADILRDLSEEVVCRCGCQVFIKRIDDQWFIRYSDSVLTEKSKKHVESMSVYPEEYFRHLPGVLDWFMDRPCARLGNWTGTRLPFDDKWIVEPISDSTLYPLFYLISRYTNTGNLKPEHLTETFFDYAFLGKGNVGELASSLSLDIALLENIRQDVEYWYPLDVNLAGKEHKTVHFPVFIMNHVAVLDKAFWPKGIFINSWVTGKGGKISKSKGGAEPIPGAAKKYSVDGMRLYYCHAGNADSDLVWDQDVVFRYKTVTERIYLLVEKLLGAKGKSSPVDGWLVSRLNEHIENITACMEEYALRDAATTAYFSIYEDLKWYQRRGGNNASLLKEVVQTWALLMCPITPHLAEELYEKSSGKGLASGADWPVSDEKKIDIAGMAVEDMIGNVVKDVLNVCKLVKIEKPSKVTLVVSADWKYGFYSELKKQLGVTRNMGEIIKNLMKDERFKSEGKHISKLVGSCLKNPGNLPKIVTSQEVEFNALSHAVSFLKDELKLDVSVEKAEESKNPKAGNAAPGKPAIVIE